MEIKSLMLIFVFFLVLVILGGIYKSKDQNQMDPAFHRLATVSGCIHQLLGKDMRDACRKESNTDSRPLWVAADRYLTCRQNAGFFSKCKEVQDPARCNPLLRLQILNTLRGACSFNQNDKEQSYIERLRSARGLKHLIRDVEEISKHIERDIYSAEEPSVIKDEKAWWEGISRRIKQAELLMKQWAREHKQLSPKDVDIQKEFHKLVMKLHNWFDRLSTRADMVPRGDMKETFLRDMMDMKSRNNELIERLQTVYTDDHIESSGHQTWMAARQNIERVFAIPLEIQDILDDLVKFIQKVDIPPVVCVACHSAEAQANVPEEKNTINHRHVWRFPSWKEFVCIALLSVVIAIAEHVIGSTKDRCLAESHFGTKTMSSKEALAEEKIPDARMLGTVETFFSR